MFKEPLENPTDPTNLASQLAALCDAYYEFHCFCAFVQQANSLIANEPMEIDETIAEGLRISGRALRVRSEAIKAQLSVLHRRVHALKSA